MANIYIPKINPTFTNIYGETFSLVREIAYKQGELMGIGKFVAETKREVNMYFDSLASALSGVNVYQTHGNPNIAYRIYKEFADYGFNGQDDARLIQNLSERNTNIKLSKFPTGVVTLDGRIIGQEIPYFPNSVTLLDYIKIKYPNINPFNLYIEVLKILKEMYDNGIIYLDNHPKNFMITEDDHSYKMNIIDFESSFVKFDDCDRLHTNNLFKNYLNMINRLNNMLGVTDKVGEIVKVDNFDNAFDQLNEKSKKLIKK